METKHVIIKLRNYKKNDYCNFKNVFLKPYTGWLRLFSLVSTKRIDNVMITIS